MFYSWVVLINSFSAEMQVIDGCEPLQSCLAPGDYCSRTECPHEFATDINGCVSQDPACRCCKRSRSLYPLIPSLNFGNSEDIQLTNLK